MSSFVFVIDKYEHFKPTQADQGFCLCLLSGIQHNMFQKLALYQSSGEEVVDRHMLCWIKKKEQTSATPQLYVSFTADTQNLCASGAEIMYTVH